MDTKGHTLYDKFGCIMNKKRNTNDRLAAWYVAGQIARNIKKKTKLMYKGRPIMPPFSKSI